MRPPQRTLSVRILGCGSSGGVPRVGGDWGECDPNEPRNRRTRCSILIAVGREGEEARTTVLVDTSPDLRCQLLAAGVTAIDHVLLTHSHADQVHGIDDLRALALRNARRIPVHLDEATADAILGRFDYCFVQRGGYPPILDAHVDLSPGRAFSLSGPGGDLAGVSLDLDHGGMRSLAFRFGGFAYCNDVVNIPLETWAGLQGLDVLIVDALRRRPHPTHAHLAKTLDWIRELRPRRAILTNMHVDMDFATLLRELPAGVEPAFDGLEFDLDAE